MSKNGNKNKGAAALAAAMAATTTGSAASATDVKTEDKPNGESQEGSEGTTASAGATETTTASAPAKTETKEAKPKRDIYGDIRNNEHLRKALWSTKGDVKMKVQSAGKSIDLVLVKKNLLDMCTADLQGKPIFLYQACSGPNGQAAKNGEYGCYLFAVTDTAIALMTAGAENVAGTAPTPPGLSDEGGNGSPAAEASGTPAGEQVAAEQKESATT